MSLLGKCSEPTKLLVVIIFWGAVQFTDSAIERICINLIWLLWYVLGNVTYLATWARSNQKSSQWTFGLMSSWLVDTRSGFYMHCMFCIFSRIFCENKKLFASHILLKFAYMYFSIFSSSSKFFKNSLKMQSFVWRICPFSMKKISEQTLISLQFLKNYHVFKVKICRRKWNEFPKEPRSRDFWQNFCRFGTFFEASHIIHCLFWLKILLHFIFSRYFLYKCHPWVIRTQFFCSHSYYVILCYQICATFSRLSSSISLWAAVNRNLTYLPLGCAY